MILCFEILFVASRCIVQHRVRARVRTRAFFLREMERETGETGVKTSITRYIAFVLFSSRIDHRMIGLQWFQQIVRIRVAP